MMVDSRADGMLPGRSESLFGRDEQLTLLQGLTVTGPTTLVCVLGLGGLGKTRLLEAFGARLLAAGLPCGPLVDFYHVESFRASIIEEAICAGLAQWAPEYQTLLEPYFVARALLERARTSGNEFRQAQQAIRATFVQSYNAIAARAAARGARITLLFDTVEQAVMLSDRTEGLLEVGETNASSGGAYWLSMTLPQLENTLVVLGGRPETLYKTPVALYDELGASLPGQVLTLTGLGEQATAELADDLRTRALASPDEQTAGVAEAIDLSDKVKLRAWYELSEGLPFWIAILFTLEFVGEGPDGVLGDLQEAVSGLAPNETLSPTQREAFRARLRDYFLGEVSQGAPPLQIALQSMATIRKGLTPALLELVLRQLQINAQPSELFERLRSLAVVKVRRVRRYTSKSERPDDLGDQEVLLFLHDELYAWLDAHPFVAVESHAVIRDTVLRWYLGAIQQAQDERVNAAEQLRFLRPGDPATQPRTIERNEALRRKHHLQREMLSYAFEGDDQGGDEALALYQLYTYEAVFNREAGQEAALHQEVLRSLYRHSRGPRPSDELTFAAIALLRAAVQYENITQARQLLERLWSYVELKMQTTGLARAFFELATANARLTSGGGTQPEERALIEQSLDEVERIVKQAQEAETPAVALHQWLVILRAQALNFRGYMHRLNYELGTAIRAYRSSNAVAQRLPGVLPQFRATTLNNLAYALSEQGDTEEARRIASEALLIRQRHGTAYDLAFSRNVMARIALRAGDVVRARQLAERSVAAMRELGNTRGLGRSLPVLADAYRKEAELLDDSPGEQDELFEQALAVLKEAEAELNKTFVAEAHREILQTRGCTLRGWGYARRRRGPAHYEIARQNLSEGHAYLLEALEVARKLNEPKFVQVDILEDLATVHVYEDEYDHRLYLHLDEAEAVLRDDRILREYLVQENAGVPEITDATRPYWRELGQCRLQRMIGAFGKLDIGLYDYDTSVEPGVRRLKTPPGDRRFLDEAAEHLVVTMAYLCRYNRHSWMLNKARELTLHELLNQRSLADIDRFQLAAYEAARRYSLLYDESFAVAEQLIALARANLDLDG